MIQQAIPIIAQTGLMYANGCGVTLTGDSTLTVNPGQMRDSTNTWDIVIPNTLNIDISSVGVNGLDTGTVQINTMYYVYVCYDISQTNLPCALVSASPTQPVMPSAKGVTYGAFRLIDCWPTDGSGDLIVMTSTTHNSGIIRKQYDTNQTILNATSGTAATVYTPLNMSQFIPALDVYRVQILAVYTPHAAGETAQIKPEADGSTFNVIYGIVASVAQSSVFDITPSLVASGNTFIPEISYRVSVATAPTAFAMYVTNFDFFI